MHGSGDTRNSRLRVGRPAPAPAAPAAAGAARRCRAFSRADSPPPQRLAAAPEQPTPPNVEPVLHAAPAGSFRCSHAAMVPTARRPRSDARHFFHVRPSCQPGRLIFNQSRLITPGTYGLARRFATNPSSLAPSTN